MNDSTSAGMPWEKMAEQVRSGQAVPLLDTNASPVLFRGEWWAIPAGDERRAYLPVRDSAQIEALDESAVDLGWTPPD